MQCPECGTNNTRVVETRKEPGNTIVRRRHECGNEHRFNTYQIHETTARGIGTTVIKASAARSERGILMRAAAWLNKTRVQRLLESGSSVEETARAVGLSGQQVRNIRRAISGKSSSLHKNNISSS